eukprot:6482572-Pyramimonas_sp.AAC.1
MTSLAKISTNSLAVISTREPRQGGGNNEVFECLRPRKFRGFLLWCESNTIDTNWFSHGAHIHSYLGSSSPKCK